MVARQSHVKRALENCAPAARLRDDFYSRDGRRGLNPFAVLANQILQSIHRFRFGNVEFNRGFADVEIHFAGRAADITKIGVGHFAWPIHDAAHDRDLHAFQVQRRRFDLGRGGLQVEQRAPARWACYVIGFKNARTCSLKHVIRQAQRLPGCLLALHQDRIANSVAKQ